MKKPLSSRSTKSKYNYKPKSSIILYFHTITEYNVSYKEAIEEMMVRIDMDNATNVVVWIGKQNRYLPIKGFMTEYQLSQYEPIVQEKFKQRSTYRHDFWKNRIQTIDVSHIPPTADFRNG